MIINSESKSEWQLSFQSYTKLLNSTAYVLRFIHNLRAAARGEQTRKDGVLSISEVEAAELLLFQDSQARTYGEEIKRLSSVPPLIMKKNSTLRLVHPMLGKEGLLLVGGRLEKANLSTLQKHPVILSPKDKVTRLLFYHFHIILAHCGPTLLLAHAGERIYVPGAKKLARDICQNCL